MPKTKELKLNGIVLARYQHSGTDLWIKPMLYFSRVKHDMTLHIMALLVGEVEKTNFTKIGPLESPNNPKTKEN